MFNKVMMAPPDFKGLPRFGFDKLSRRYAGAHLSSPEIESVITIYASSSSNSLH